MVGYRFLNDLAFSEEQKEVMGKHRDLREVRVRQHGHHARKPQGDERAERWRDPGRTMEQACNDTRTSAGDNPEPSAPEHVCQNSLHMSSFKTTCV